MATYSYAGHAYMKKLPEEKLRELPDGKKQDNSQFKPPHKTNMLALSDLYPEQKYVNFSPENSHKWSDKDVNNVVNFYLRSTQHGGNPMEPQPHVMCECCMDINEDSKIRRRGLLQEAMDKPETVPKVGTRPPSPQRVEKPPVPIRKDSREDKQVRFAYPSPENDHEPRHEIPFYRSDYDGPEMVAPARYSNDLGGDDEDTLDTRTVFVTHPSKRYLYSKWRVDEELGSFGKNRYVAEDIVEASSKYVDSMDKLKKWSQND